MADKTLYKEDSIESLSPLEFCRLKPSLYAGDTTYSTQLVIEVVSNCIDEARLGHGKEIDVTIEKDVVTVRDRGQGFIPDFYRDDGKSILEAAFSVLNTSGKYRSDGTYEGTSLGSFGIGAKITNFLSHWLTVATCRDGKEERIKFVEGVFSEREITKVNSDYPRGTVVEWQPSEEFFTHTEPEIDKLKELFQTLACLCPGVTINLNNNGEKISYYSERGLSELVDRTIGDKEIIKNRFEMNYGRGKNKMDFILTYTSQYSSKIIPYVNMGLTENGQHITQIKTLITREFNKFFKEKEWVKEKAGNLSGDDIQEGMYVIFNINTSDVHYDGQIKTKITKIDMTPFTSALGEELRNWLEENEKEIKAIAMKAIDAQKAREAAKKARDNVRNKKSSSKLRGKMDISDKFIDCSNNSSNKKNLLIVEGKSAATSAVEARNPKTDCIYMLTGKTISPLKASKEKVMNNAVIKDIIGIVNAGFDADFDVSKVKFDKIVITSDQDAE